MLGVRRMYVEKARRSVQGRRRASMAWAIQASIVSNPCRRSSGEELSGERKDLGFLQSQPEVARGPHLRAAGSAFGYSVNLLTVA